MGWFYCWFSTLLREGHSPGTPVFFCPQNQHLQISIRSGRHGHFETSFEELLSASLVNQSQFTKFSYYTRQFHTRVSPGYSTHARLTNPVWTLLACEQALLIWASEASLARTRERGAPRDFAARSRVLARLVSLAQIGELARRLELSASLQNPFRLRGLWLLVLQFSISSVLRGLVILFSKRYCFDSLSNRKPGGTKPILGNPGILVKKLQKLCGQLSFVKVNSTQRTPRFGVNLIKHLLV